MTMVDITETDVQEVKIKRNPTEIIINGKALDLSKVTGLTIDFNPSELEVVVSTFGVELPYKQE